MVSNGALSLLKTLWADSLGRLFRLAIGNLESYSLKHRTTTSIMIAAGKLFVKFEFQALKITNLRF